MAETVQELLDQLSAALAGDAEVMRSIVEDDVLLLGTDPGEEVEGADAAVAAMADQAESLGAMTFASEDDRRMREAAEVAWFAEHGSMRFGQRGLRVRLTGVAVRRSGRWRLAQVQAAPCQVPVDLDAGGS
jgi:hypothetical protein